MQGRPGGIRTGLQLMQIAQNGRSSYDVSCLAPVMSGGQKSYPLSMMVRNLLTVAYETQGLAYGGRFS